MSLTSSAGTPQPSLAWQFEGTTTDYVTGLTGTTTGSVTYGPGKYKQGMSVFNVVGTDSASNLVSYSVVLNSTNGFTVSVWTRVDVVKTGSYASMIGLSATTNTGGFLNFFDINENAGGTFGLYGQNQGASGVVSVSFNTSTTPVLSGWYHVTTVFTNSTISMYVNGIASGSATYANAFTTNTMYLGRSGQYSGHSYCGSYDDLRVYNTALTSTQVQSIYNQQGMPGRGALQNVVGSVRTALTGTPLFSQLSQAATSSAVGAFSLRAVNGTSVKAVNVVPGGIFPPSAMTQTGTNSSTQTLGTGGKFQGSYTASSSTSAYGWGASGAFGLAVGQPYLWQVGNYPAGGGTVSTPTTTTTGATNYNGEWLQFQTPFPINLTGYSTATMFLTSFVLLASTTGATSSWTLVDSQTVTDGQAVTKTGLNFAGYSYFRFVVITSTTNYPYLANVRFNGTVPSLTQAQFPPSAMTSAAVVSGGGLIFTQTLSGGFYAGQYVASCSRYDYGWSPIGAFDLTNSLPIWQVNSAYTTGKYTGATTTAGYGGEWIQLQVPSLVKITSYYINSVWTSDFVLLGSTDASTWTLIDTQTGLTNGQLKTITGLNPSYYSYYRFVITKSYTNVSYPGFNNIILYGSNTDFYADTQGNLLTAPVVGQALADWLGGATGYVTTWYDQSGAGNHATQATTANQPIIQRATKGPGYSCLFNGTTNYVSATTSSNVYDNTNYSVCAVSWRTAAGPSQEFYTGSNGTSVATNSKVGFGYINTGTQLQIGVYNAVYYGPNVPGYSSGSEPAAYDYFTFSTTLGFKIYSWRNSTAYSQLTATTTPQNLSGPSIDIGRGQGSSYFTGEINEIIIFQNSLYQTGGDSLVTQIYNNQLSYTGT